ncbi:MAG TPA: ABC transporter permease [Gemmatimonadaceae bacterium]|nr:ABC transporter permease [Gemmatimonadaceae bacterium]
MDPRSWIPAFSSRVRLLRSWRSAEARMEEEFRFHLEMEAALHEREGATREDARRLALVAFGGVERHKEAMRDTRGARWIADALQDIRFAVRTMARRPGFALMALLTIAIGIGATTTVFTLANAVLFRPLPVPEPDRLVAITEHRGGAVSQGLEGTDLPYDRYVEYRDATSDIFSGLAAQKWTSFSMRALGAAVPVHGSLTSGNYFTVLGVRPALGRFFARDDERSVVISYRFWQTEMAGDSSAVGGTVYLNGKLLTVAGVAPMGFEGTSPGIGSDIWVPVAGMRDRKERESMSAWLAPFGRLRPGVEISHAAARVDELARRIPPGEPQTRVRGASLESMNGIFRGVIRRDAGQLLTMLFGTALLVLLIASANVAGMLLARGVARRREVGTRLAIGAGRGRLVRQLLTESALLGIGGGAIGVLLGIAGSSQLMQRVSIPFTTSDVSLRLSPDLRVLGVALLITGLTVLLFGMVPALQGTRASLLSALRDGGGASGAHTRWRTFFVGGQLALAVFLLVLGGLLLRSLERTLAVNLGYDASRTVIATVDPGQLGYDSDSGRAFYDQLVARLRATPGVQRVALARSALVGGAPSSNDMEAADADSGATPASSRERRYEPGVPQNIVDTAFFSMMRLPLVAGRGFTAADSRSAPPVVVVNETLANLFWPGENPVGRRVKSYGGEAEVVGVVRDGRWSFSSGNPRAFAFFPFAQHYSGAMVVHVRGTLAPDALTAQLRRIAGTIDPDVAVQGATPLTTAVDAMLASLRVLTTIVALFAAAGLLLAAIGVYGVLAFQVEQRRREMGIRIALGASARKLTLQVIGRTGIVALAGALVGLGVGVMASFILSHILYGVGRIDIVTFTLIPPLLTAVAIVACAGPVRRAISVDPVEVLRAE